MTEDVSDRLLRLPFYNMLDDASQARVIEGVIGFQP
jgi:dTDP-4-amino-4,6-dideoxygalactose transaminase